MHLNLLKICFKRLQNMKLFGGVLNIFVHKFTHYYCINIKTNGFNINFIRIIFKFIKNMF